MRAGGAHYALPALAGTLLQLLLPMLATLALALFRFDSLSAPQWVGLEQLRALAADPLYRQALHNSLLLVALAVPLRLGLALLLGLLLARREPLAQAALAPVLLPVVLPGIVWALAWLWLLSPSHGPLATWLDRDTTAWLLSAPGARLSVILVLTLLVGELVLILRAARRLIPQRHYEVCALEGASPFFALRRVTLPALRPVLGLLALRDLALCLQLSFLPALIITKTGPQFATLYLPYYGWQNAFEYLRFGYAAAVNSALVLLVLAGLAGQLWLLRRWQPPR